MRIRRRYSLEDQSRDRYPRLAFEVLAGTTNLDVSLVVRGDAVVDLGCEGPDGWRGWSGGARRDFVIAADDATPGYLPGRLEAGTWYVVLGLHSLPSGFAEVEVDVATDTGRRPDHGPKPEPRVREGRARGSGLPAPDGTSWYAGDTHAHSLHSDGALSLWELANRAVESGLDFLCVTDHNTVSHHRFLQEVGERHGVTLVPGQEVTTHRGHANVYGEVGFIDFRRPANEWLGRVSQ